MNSYYCIIKWTCFRFCFQDVVEGLAEDKLREIVIATAKRHPSFWHDVQSMVSDGTVAGAPNQGYHPSACHPPSWCVCTHCREMPTLEERRCCGKTARCTTQDHHWYFLLDPFNISLHNGFRNDLLGDMEDGNYNKCLRHGSYRICKSQLFK